MGWGRELGGKVLALIDLLLGSAARSLKIPHTRTKASAWGEGRSKLGLGTLRAETAPIKQTRRPFLGTLTSGDTTAGIERPRGALGVAGGGRLSHGQSEKVSRTISPPNLLGHLKKSSHFFARSVPQEKRQKSGLTDKKVDQRTKKWT